MFSESMRRAHVRGAMSTVLSVALLSGIAAVAQADHVQLTWMNQMKRPSIGPPADSFALAAQAFEKQHPDISVETTYGMGWAVQLLAGGGPDVIGDCCTRLHEAGMDGQFLDLTPFLGTVLPDYMKNRMFWPPQWSAFTDRRGHQFGLPLYLGTIGMYANTDLFRAAGLAVPSADLGTNHQDWNAFEALCKKLTRVDASGRITQYGFAKASYQDRFGYWLMDAGAQYYVDNDPYRSALASPEAVQALTYLQRLKNQDQCMSFDRNNFWEGKAGILEEGSWKLGKIVGATATGTAKVPFGVQVFPMPLGPSGHRYTLATIDGLAVNRNTKHAKEAVELLGFAAGKQAEEMRAKYNGLQPALKSVVPEYLDLMNSMNLQAFKIQDHVFTDAGPYAYPQKLYADMKAANSLLGAARSKIFNENAPVKSTWYSAVDALNSILASEKATGGAAAPHPAQSLQWAGADWTSQDINMTATGGATVQGNAITLHTAGSDIWGAADQFHYVYQKVSGNFTATVRLVRSPDTSSWSKTGIMVRQSTDPSSAQLILCGTGGHGITIQYRAKAKDSSHSTGSAKWTNGTPVWLKLVRRGNVVTGYSSSDDRTWTKIGSEQIALSDPVLVGLASTSHAYAMLGDATFENWTLSKG